MRRTRHDEKSYSSDKSKGFRPHRKFNYRNRISQYQKEEDELLRNKKRYSRKEKIRKYVSGENLYYNERSKSKYQRRTSHKRKVKKVTNYQPVKPKLKFSEVHLINQKLREESLGKEKKKIPNLEKEKISIKPTLEMTPKVKMVKKYTTVKRSKKVRKETTERTHVNFLLDFMHYNFNNQRYCEPNETVSKEQLEEVEEERELGETEEQFFSAFSQRGELQLTPKKEKEESEEEEDVHKTPKKSSGKGFKFNLAAPEFVYTPPKKAETVTPTSAKKIEFNLNAPVFVPSPKNSVNKILYTNTFTPPQMTEPQQPIFQFSQNLGLNYSHKEFVPRQPTNFQQNSKNYF